MTTVFLCGAALGWAAPAIAQDAPAEAPPNVEHTTTPQGPTTPFDELVAEGLAEHPAVEARRADVEAERARVRGVGLLPDPTVSLSAESIPWNDPGLANSGMSGVQLGITQPLWWPGELRALREQVEAEAGAREPLVDERQVDLVLQAAALYYDIYRIDRTVEALEGLKAPVREFIRLLRARIPTGDATVSQVERVRLELLRIDDEIFMLVHQRPELVEKLNALLNRPAGSPVNPPAEEGDEAAGGGEQAQSHDQTHDRTSEPLDRLETLVERGMQNRPMVQALEQRKLAARAGAEAARWEKYPNLSVTGGWRFRAATADEPTNAMDDGTDYVSLGVSGSLPIWSGERAGAAEDVAQAQVVSIDSEIGAFRLELRGEIAGHLAELHHLHRHVAYYRDELIPQATQARRAAMAGFEAGRARYEDWLGAERRLVDLESKLARLEASVRKHRALILALTGEIPTPDGDIDGQSDHDQMPENEEPNQDEQPAGEQAPTQGEQ